MNELYATIGRLEVEKKFLKKKVKSELSVTMRRTQIEKDNTEVSVRSQCKLLSINRSGIYYQSKSETEFNFHIMRILDELFLKNPTYGVLSMVDELKDREIIVNQKRVRRLLRLMGYMAIYPKKNLSKMGDAQYIYPYLLRNLEITAPNQVWAIDITYNL